MPDPKESDKSKSAAAKKQSTVGFAKKLSVDSEIVVGSKKKAPAPSKKTKVTPSPQDVPVPVPDAKGKGKDAKKGKATEIDQEAEDLIEYKKKRRATSKGAVSASLFPVGSVSMKYLLNAAALRQSQEMKSPQEILAENEQRRAIHRKRSRIIFCSLLVASIGLTGLTVVLALLASGRVFSSWHD